MEMAANSLVGDQPPIEEVAQVRRPIHGPTILLGLLACAAALMLQMGSLYHPILWFDDFPILVGSWTWKATILHLWEPFNEHAMPLGRLSTWALIQLAGKPSALPFLTSWQGPFGVLLAMGLVYLFVRRELEHPLYGLVAMVLFGVSTQYQEAVRWFAASFTILALDFTLLGLLAAQRWRQGGRWYHLGLSAFWTALAPTWFASGILAGPLCGLYLMPLWFDNSDNFSSRPPKIFFRFLAALIPSLGTLVFLAITLPFTANHIMHLEHYNGKTAVEAFNLEVGLEYTGRSLVDNLVPGMISLQGKIHSAWQVIGGLILLTMAGACWWCLAPNRRMLLLGLGFILINDVLIYSARSGWPYTQLHVWTRYQLMPMLGLAFFICGGLPRLRKWGLQPDPQGSLSCKQIGALALLTFVVLLSQAFHQELASARYYPDQNVVLKHIDEVDARCKTFHIDAEIARQALGTLYVPWCGDDSNGWKLLRGSQNPEPYSILEVKKLLIFDAGTPP